MSEFVRAAVLEKAERELARLDQRLGALNTVANAQNTLNALAEGLARATAPVAAIAHDASAITRFKKLRRAVEDAQALASELAIQLEVNEGLSEAHSERAGIVVELENMGISETSGASSSRSEAAE